MISSLDARVHRRTGRTIGVLLLVQLVFAPVSNFVLLKPVFAAPGFLENAAAHSLQISLGALLGLAMGAISLGIAIAAFPLFRPLNRTLALWFLALAVASFSLTAGESTTVMSLLSLSQAYLKADSADSELFQGLRVVVASARNWAHYIGLMVFGHRIVFLMLLPLGLSQLALAAWLVAMGFAQRGQTASRDASTMRSSGEAP